MNLSYSILWFDDQQEFFESLDTAYIEEEIASWGFNPKIIPVHTPEEFRQHAPFDSFDLIVVDLDLGDNEHGAKFIKNVRDQEVFTEIIFYSSQRSSDIWEAVKLEMLEGVFVANKRSGMEQKVVRVALQSVRKVLDLDNMRGIVMSEVGELDGLLEEIFNIAMEGLNEEQRTKIYERFHEKMDEDANEYQKTLAAFKDAPSIEGLLELCDSDKRWQNFNRVKRHHDLLKRHDLAGDYTNEILKPRNFLAHGVPKKQADGTFIFTYKGKHFNFDDGVSKSLRQKILEYKQAFIDVAKLLNRQ